MQSIYFGIFVLLIGWVIFWSIKNDRARSIGDQKGLFSMRLPKEQPGAGAPKPFDGYGAEDTAGQGEEALPHQDPTQGPDRAA